MFNYYLDDITLLIISIFFSLTPTPWQRFKDIINIIEDIFKLKLSLDLKKGASQRQLKKYSETHNRN